MNSQLSETLPETHTLLQYLVGVGASAGGLEAINDFFDNMPSNTGFSFVVIQHLSPDHKSMMAELLSKHTQMPVFEAEDGTIPQPNCIYLIPVKQRISIKFGKLRLEEKLRDHQPNNAIDQFFLSLAMDRKDKSVGIILSGTGTDGTIGIEAIKNAGGIVVVQDPITAQFDGMPNSAISSGYVDLILSPEMIPDELLEFVREAPLLRSFTALTNQEEALLLDILQLLQKNTGHDFSSYKRPTINRRLAKRMAEKSIRSLADYYVFLLHHPDELRHLCKEFLLHVTRFFRDEEAFEFLKNNVIKVLLSKKERGDTLKTWTVACSTGEEAYSLAILFDEAMHEENKLDVEVKIFATDISQDVVEKASRGLYNEEQIKSISPERLKKYFIRESSGYRVHPTLRKMIVFAKHDISKDPAFSKIDLLTCRNMLIYMNTTLQKNIFQKFHFALNEDGYLFLGPSENIGSLKDAMQEIERKWKIFKCISKTRLPGPESFSNPFDRITHPTHTAPSKTKNALSHLPDVFKETLLEEYEFAGIFIDRDFEVKQAIGHFKKFMDFPDGTFNFNLLKLVPNDLSIPISTAVRKAIKENERVIARNVKLTTDTKERTITIIVKPYLVQKTYMQPFLFIILKEEELESKPIIVQSGNKGHYSKVRITELEQELRDTRENLQALLEEVESANEELQSSNEEIVSSNEELQSTNEELQSLNEELHTVNAEHQLKIKELFELNDDLNNYFRTTDIGQIIIDKKLIIRKFTPIVTKQVNLISSDIGRSITDISTNMVNLDFINDIKTVLQSGKPLEKEISVEDEKAYLMRIAPYLRQNNLIDGVVVNFIDITEIKTLNNTLEAVFNSSTSGIIRLQAIRNPDKNIIDFRFASANNAASMMVPVEQTIGKTFQEWFGPADQQIFDTYVQVVETGETASFRYQNPKTQIWLEIVGVKMMDGLVITFNDVTDQIVATERIRKGYETLKQTMDQLEITNYQLQQSNLDLMQFASVASHDLKEPLRKVQAFGNLLKDRVMNKLDINETNYLDKVITSTCRMQVLIDDILTLSRLSKNDSPQSLVDLNQTVHQILDDLEISIQETGASISVQHLPTVMAIPGQMHQLLQNLISNSLKFVTQAPVISIGQENISDALREEFKINGHEYLNIFIQDNGIGFDQQYHDKIFGIFQRLEKTNYQGTGIGLAIAKKIVDNHKGFIKATSQPGQGAKFTILLPNPGLESQGH
jgi:two-component system CheB/CheR fusion protein